MRGKPATDPSTGVYGLPPGYTMTAVQLTNNQGTIAAAQKASRRANRSANSREEAAEGALDKLVEQRQ